MTDNDSKLSAKDKIHQEALERFKLCEEANVNINKEAKTDLKFRKGDHWPDDIRNTRNQDNRPCLTINKMPQFIRKVSNDQKQNRPAIDVNPVDDYADIETAEVLQGLIRNIENVSDAEYAYDKAFEGAASASFGYFRVITDYVGDSSFEQEVRIDMIDNPFKVTLDPYHIKPDGSDSKFGFIWDTMTKAEFKEAYGESKLAKHSDWEIVGADNKGWAGEDEVRVAEYFYKDIKKIMLYELSDGEKYFEDELPEKNENDEYFIMQEYQDEYGDIFEEQEVLTVENKRMSQRCTIKWLKINAIEILEETVWPGSHIPIIPVYGDVINIDGEIIRESVIRHARDSQQILNFWASTEAETITLAPKAPYIGAAGQFKGHEQAWAQANTKNYPYLEYTPTSHEGMMVAPPQRQAFEPPVMAITQARALANDDIKATTGIYDTSLGGASNETSGIAIQRRNVQSEISNFHLIDNLSKSIRHCGRILVEIIPKIYDTERVIRTLGLDGKQDRLLINSAQNLLEGQKRAYDFSVGKYDVVVTTGPSYETKRQEARDSMIQMSGANPKFAEVAGDLLVQNMDWPGAKEIAERIKKTMPPEIVGDDEDEMPPQAKAVLAQLTQQLEGMKQELMQAQDIIKTDSIGIQSKERIETMKIQADLKKEVVKIQGTKEVEVLKGQIDILQERLKTLDTLEPIDEIIEDQIDFDYNQPQTMTANPLPEGY